MGEEVLYQGERTQVVRRPAPGGSGSVVCKRASGPGAVRRIEHERTVLGLLAGLPGVPRLAARQSRQALILEDDAAPASPGSRRPFGSICAASCRGDRHSVRIQAASRGRVDLRSSRRGGRHSVRIQAASRGRIDRSPSAGRSVSAVRP
jgi:hypothetical protein